MRASPGRIDRRPGNTPVTRAARRLRHAALTGVPCEPVRDLIGDSDLAAAYAVQQENVQERVASGARIVGRKVGLTSPSVQAQLGVDRPDFGVLLEDMQYADDMPVPMSRLLQPKVEAEIAFVLGSPLDGDTSDRAVRAAVDHAVVALEIVDSRITGWDITFADTVADNASSGLFILGTRRLTLADVEPRETAMTMHVDDHPASVGTGAACLGDPLAALAWLARTAREVGHPLQAGEVVLSGALGPMAPVAAGQHVRAELTTADGRPLGIVSTRVTEETP